jgi:hypothetical protein
MNRDLKKFPNDENGNVLWALHQKGVPLGEEQEVRFAVIFPKSDDALKFGVFLLRQGYWVQVNEIEDHPGFLGEVLADIYLETTHSEISGAESWLAEHSASLGGKTDGWSLQSKTANLVSAEWQPVA